MARLLCVGIDVATRLNRAQFVDDGELPHGRLSFPNDAAGASLIATHTKQLADTIGVKQVRFGLEATGFYGWHLAMYLCKAPELGDVQTDVYLFNPNTVHGFKLSYPDLPKTDRADAFAIAERLRFGRLPRPFALNERYLPLQRLTRTAPSSSRAWCATRTTSWATWFSSATASPNLAKRRILRAHP